jgi:nucleoside-diphosphate-sugar epimerase
LRTRVAAQDDIRAMVVRPPVIWGNEVHGFVSSVLTSIEKTGKACYIGDGLNLYTHVHVEDLAELYRLVLEKGSAGALYHSAAGELNNRMIAALVARQQNVGTISITPSQAVEIWSKFTMLIVMGVSSRSRSPRTRDELGWRPTRLDLIGEILDGKLGRPKTRTAQGLNSLGE